MMQITTIDSAKITSCASGTAPAPSATTDCAERDAAAEDPPVERVALDLFGSYQKDANDRNRRDREAEQKNGRPAEEAREPARRAGHREDAERQREAAEHLHQTEFSADVVLGARISGIIGAWHDLGRHRVGNHVLGQRPDHDQKRAEQIGLLRPRELQRAGRRRSEDEHAAGREGGANEDVGAPLRAEDRHTVDELTEHHLHGPRQAQPHAYTGKLGRAEPAGSP